MKGKNRFFYLLITSIIIVLFVCLIQGNYRTVLSTDTLIAPWEPEGGYNSPNSPVPIMAAPIPNTILHDLIAPWDPEGGYNSPDLTKYLVA